MAVALDQPKTIDLQVEHLNRTILKLAAPAIAESLLTTLVYLSDTILIGWMNDPVALAAVGLSGTLMWAADGIFQAISVSVSAMVARFWGEKDFDYARAVAGQSLSLSVIVALILMAILIPIARFFLQHIMGGEPDVALRGALYVRIILATSPISFLLTISNSIMRATGDTQKPMIITGLMNTVNVLVSIVLIFGLGPIPRMGLAGVAIATSLARTLGGAISLSVLFAAKGQINLGFAHVRHWDWRLLWRMLRISLPNIGETLISRLGFILFTRILSTLGTIALAAHQIALRVESIAYMPGWGLATSIAAFVGQSLGAKRQDVAEQGIRSALVMGNGAMAFFGFVMIVFGPGIVRLFGVQNPILMAMATTVIRISALELFGLGSLMILGGCLRGAGDTRTPMIVTMVGTFLFRVPITYLFALVLNGGLKGVWLATAVDWSMRALIMCFLYLRGRWKTVTV
ncbi:MAG: MATE family efflux transporter [Anaerolineae bacterium]|nr:MATE family efflux transporter [Anaerolineae bacterium]